ncbi:MAG: hypothetical protein IPI66_13290 [Chitinophagaceae bacterium]|nr:hypothetical protein [Chitinophagaceae bacterium]MBL0056910.1 hypothetical protein [Chitinophagaceae bacterium]
MNSTHLHLLLNHFPIIGTLIGSCLLIWGIIRKQESVKFSAALILTFMAVIAIPVYLTGEPTEETVEDLAGVSESMISLHESAANLAIWLMGITGIASLATLLLDRLKHKAAGIGYILTLVISLACFAAMARTGYYGGQIRHTELSSGAVNSIQENGKDGETGKGEGNRKDND